MVAHILPHVNIEAIINRWVLKKEVPQWYIY
jgi:hypothetical protein